MSAWESPFHPARIKKEKFQPEELLEATAHPMWFPEKLQNHWSLAIVFDDQGSVEPELHWRNYYSGARRSPKNQN
jgi:hypothetical protein